VSSHDRIPDVREFERKRGISAGKPIPRYVEEIIKVSSLDVSIAKMTTLRFFDFGVSEIEIADWFRSREVFIDG